MMIRKNAMNINGPMIVPKFLFGRMLRRLPGESGEPVILLLDSGFRRNDKCKYYYKTINESAAQAQRGFTLLEIMISLVLICLVVVSVIQLSSANLRNLADSDDSIEALVRANDKMREVLDSETFEERSWTDKDNEGYACDITIAEIEKERFEALPVRLMQITVTAGKTDDKRSKKITLKTAKMTSKSDALTGEGKSVSKVGP